jgi:hypothetical protein
VTVDPSERELLAQLLGMAVVGLDADRAVEEKCLVESVELLLNGLGCALGGRDLLPTVALRAFQICRTDSLRSRM